MAVKPIFSESLSYALRVPAIKERLQNNSAQHLLHPAPWAGGGHPGGAGRKGESKWCVGSRMGEIKTQPPREGLWCSAVDSLTLTMREIKESCWWKGT